MSKQPTANVLMQGPAAHIQWDSFEGLESIRAGWKINNRERVFEEKECDFLGKSSPEDPLPAECWFLSSSRP